MTQDEKVAKLKKKHEAIQGKIFPNDIRIREAILLTNLQTDSIFPFEFFCWRSPEMTKEMDLFIEKCKGKKFLLDIGAHHGIFSLVFDKLNPEGTVFAFEPNKPTFGILSRNISSSHINASPWALSNTFGKLGMYHEWDHLVAGGKTEELIPCTPGDYFKDLLTPDIIKIDVEGHEIEVIEGLKITIEKYKPDIFLEVHPSRIKYSGNDIAKLVELLKGYRAYNIDDNKLYDMERLTVADQDVRLFLTV